VNILKCPLKDACKGDPANPPIYFENFATGNCAKGY